jgi:hypothetical protein
MALPIHVLATGVDPTRSALRTAAVLAAGLNAEIDVLIPYVVSFAEALETPAGDLKIAAEPYRDLAAGMHVSANVRLCVCRRVADVLKVMLPEHSIVVVAGRHRQWWPTAAQRTARQLAGCGHRVVFAEVA